MRSWLSAWEACRVEARECRELDAERVLVFTRVSGRGKASGLDLGSDSPLVEDWQGSYEDYKVDVEEIRDLGNGVTLAVSLQTGRPAGSTGEVQIRFASIQVCEDGLIAWMKNYNEIDETRAAAERLAAKRG